MLDGLRQQGYIEGKNLTVERRYGSAPGERVEQLAGELAAMSLDAVLTTCTPTTTIAKRAMPSTPIVMAAVSDPVGVGLIASLRRPGGNVTGLSSQGEELLPKMFELFSMVLPRATVVAVLGNLRNPAHVRMWQKMNSLKQVEALNLRLRKTEVSNPADVPEALDAAERDRARALLVLGDDPLMLNQRTLIVQLAAKHRLPDFYWAREFVDDGGLMSYGENLRGSYRGAASYIARVARGAKPGELPVAQPTRFELVLNRKTAKTLGLVLPEDLMLLADEVIG